MIVNRYGQDSGQISLKKARDTIGRERLLADSERLSVMVEVRNNGAAAAAARPKAAITQSIGQLADLALRQRAKTRAPATRKSSPLAQPLVKSLVAQAA